MASLVSVISLQVRGRTAAISLVIPLALSTITHLWNPIGFPAIHADENTYLLRSMQVLSAEGVLPTGAPHYDHPYFGQTFLAAIWGTIGYPQFLNPVNGTTDSIEFLHLVPRILMGLLAVVDTFLVYKISETRYNRRVAFIAAVLFAVMPFGWLLRRVLLDNLLLPFLLFSIWFCICMRKPKNESTITTKNLSVILVSGIFLGLAIFTKIPAFTFIPLIGYLVFTNSNKSWKILGLWLIPVILVPVLWPVLASSAGQFDNWFDAIILQATEREDKPLIDSIRTFSKIDPVLLTIGIIGIIYTCLKRDLFVLLSVIPYLIFLQLVGFVSVHHLILLAPAICIASSVVISELSSKIKNDKIQKVLPLTVISVVGIFGLLVSLMIINIDFNSSYFRTYAAIVQNLPDGSDEDKRNGINTGDKQTIVIGRYWTKSFIWATQYAFDKKYDFVRDNLKCCSGPSQLLLEEIILNARNNNVDSNGSTNSFPKIILIADNRIKRGIRDNNSEAEFEKIKTLYDLTHTIQIIEDKGLPYDRSKYPYSGLYDNRGIGKIDIRSN